MRTILSIVLIVSLSGCASAAKFSPEETCAMQGRKLIAYTSGTATNSGYSYYGGPFAGSSSISSISCAPPETESDQCKINKFARSAEPKQQYNKGMALKRWITGMGYVAFIAPGVVAKIIYSKQKRDAEDASSGINRSLANSCPFEK